MAAAILGRLSRRRSNTFRRSQGGNQEQHPTATILQNKPAIYDTAPAYLTQEAMDHVWIHSDPWIDLPSATVGMFLFAAKAA
jgi:hypothetical protein